MHCPSSDFYHCMIYILRREEILLASKKDGILIKCQTISYYSFSIIRFRAAQHQDLILCIQFLVLITCHHHYVSLSCLMHRLFSVLGVPYFYNRVPSDFCLQNLNHPFYTLREQFLSNRNHAHLALFACFNINQNDKTFTFHSLGCFIIFYFSGNVCIYMLDLLEVCARPYSIKTLNIN